MKQGYKTEKLFFKSTNNKTKQNRRNGSRDIVELQGILRVLNYTTTAQYGAPLKRSGYKRSFHLSLPDGQRTNS